MKNKILSFLMVLGMIGLLVGCSKLTKMSQSGYYKFTKEEKADILKDSNEKDVFELSIDELKFEDKEELKFVNESLKNLYEEIEKDYYETKYNDSLEFSVYMPDDSMTLYSYLSSEVYVNEKDIISILFTEESYGGGPHGNMYYFTINYDIKNQKELKLNDIFKEEAKEEFYELLTNKVDEYVEENSIYVFDDYKDYIVESIENEFIFIDDDKLEFIFNTYVIAPHSEGTIFIDFDKSELSNILKDEYK